MANILDSIQLSGSSYDLKDKSATTMVNVTQAEYDALVSGGTVDPTILYNITDAQAGDLSQYWTSAQTQSAITEATSGKVNTSSVVTAVTSGSTDAEIPTAKAVWEAASGGGSTYSAGRGIDITNDTISVSLPISAGTDTDSIICGHDYGNDMFLSAYTPYADSQNSFAFGSASVSISQNSFATGYLVKVKGGPGTNGNFAQGYMTLAKGNRCHAEGLCTSATSDASHSEGYNTIASGNYSHSEGEEVKATNVAEHSQGRYNVSTTASTTWGDSGNTLFSVGNGTADNARHNAFEIRQNGDIYITSGGTDIKLQDNLGGGGITSGEVQSMIDESVSGKADTSAVTESIDAAVSGKVDTTTFEIYSGNVETSLSGKQNTLSAGTNITITDNVISAQLEGGTVSRGDVEDMIEEATSGLQETLSAGTGIEISGNVISTTGTSITIDPSLDSGSTNPVANSAITAAIANAVDGKLKEDLIFKTTCGYGTIHSNVGLVSDTYLIINTYPTKEIQFIHYRSRSKNYKYEIVIQDIVTKDTYRAYYYVTYNTLQSSGGTGVNYASIIVSDGNLKFTVIDGYRIIGLVRDMPSNREHYGISTLNGYYANIPSGTTISELFQYIENVSNNLKGLTFDNLGGIAWQYFTDKYGGVLYYEQTVFPTNDSFTGHTASTVMHTTQAEKDSWNGKLDASAITSSVTSASTDSEVPSAKAVYDAIPQGGGMSADMEQLIATSLVDLNDRKADKSLLSGYQKKGDYATKSELATKANASEVMTLEKATQNELITASALNNLNNKFGGLKLVKITESEYAALSTKDENTLYIVVADPT